MLHPWYLFYCFLPFLKEIFLYFLSQMAAVLIMIMGIEVGHHPRLGMTRITLDDLDVAAADLELQRGTEMPQAVEDDGCQVILISEFSKQRPRFGVPHRACRPDV